MQKRSAEIEELAPSQVQRAAVQMHVLPQLAHLALTNPRSGGGTPFQVDFKGN